MLACMITDSGEWGPRLYAYLEEHWRATGTNANAWAYAHPGIQGPTLSRWRAGVVAPSIQAMRAVADALGVSLIDVLLAAGIIDPAEANGRTAVEFEAPTIDAAIDRDPSLVKWQRDKLREILKAMRDVESGAEVVTNRPRRRR